LEDDLEARTTNLIERSFEEERGRTKTLPRFFDEQSALKLVFATLTRATRQWQKIHITELEQKQMQKLRQSLGLDPDPNSGKQQEQLESEKNQRYCVSQASSHFTAG
jgi:hypothetical protein